jgi:hypothetical protein
MERQIKELSTKYVDTDERVCCSSIMQGTNFNVVQMARAKLLFGCLFQIYIAVS